MFIGSSRLILKNLFIKMSDQNLFTTVLYAFILINWFNMIFDLFFSHCKWVLSLIDWNLFTYQNVWPKFVYTTVLYASILVSYKHDLFNEFFLIVICTACLRLKLKDLSKFLIKICLYYCFVRFYFSFYKTRFSECS